METKRFVLSVALATVGCIALPAHSSPADVTDGEIGMYRWAMQKGCTDQGIGRGDDPGKVTALCECIMGKLANSMTHEDWQRATYAAQKNRGRAEARVLGPHLATTKACSAGA